MVARRMVRFLDHPAQAAFGAEAVRLAVPDAGIPRAALPATRRPAGDRDATARSANGAAWCSNKRQPLIDLLFSRVRHRDVLASFLPSSARNHSSVKLSGSMMVVTVRSLYGFPVLGSRVSPGLVNDLAVVGDRAFIVQNARSHRVHHDLDRLLPGVVVAPELRARGRARPETGLRTSCWRNRPPRIIFASQVALPSCSLSPITYRVEHVPSAGQLAQPLVGGARARRVFSPDPDLFCLRHVPRRQRGSVPTRRWRKLFYAFSSLKLLPLLWLYCSDQRS